MACVSTKDNHFTQHCKVKCIEEKCKFLLKKTFDLQNIIPMDNNIF
jgi:hypothetical protein